MKRWSIDNGSFIESEKIDSFIKEIDEICQKFNVEIKHEDYGGAFIIRNRYEGNMWFANAGVKGFDDEELQ